MRLRELCMELLGPPFPPAVQGPGGPAEAQAEANGDIAMAEASGMAQPSSVSRDGSGAGAGAGTQAGPSRAWEPRLLGLDKREDLLSGEVLRVVGRSRAMGGLAQEMRDLLDDLRLMGDA